MEYIKNMVAVSTSPVLLPVLDVLQKRAPVQETFLETSCFETLFTVLQSTPGASVANEGYDRIPPIAKITFTGILPRGVTGKDVIVALCGLFNQDDVLNHALEFTGSDETLASIPIDARLTIANMTTEWGALSGMA